MNKMLSKIALFFLLITFCLIAAAPLIVSTDAGTSFALSFINKKIPGSLHIEDTYLSWFGKQNLYRIKLNNSTSESIANIDRIEVDASLFSLILNPENFNKLTVENANIKIVQDDKGVTDLQDALGFKKISSTGLKTPVYIENGEIGVLQGGGRELIIKATGNTRQNDIKGDFSIDISFQNIGKQKVNLQASRFPTLVLDQSLAITNPNLSGLLVETIGEYIQISIDQDSKSNDAPLEIAVASPFMKADLIGNLSNQTLSIEPGGLFKFEIPVENGDRIFDILGLDSLHVASPLSGTITNSMLSIPLTHDQIQNLDGQIVVRLNANKVSSAKGLIELAGFHASIKTDKSTPDLGLHLNVEGEKNGDPLHLVLNFEIPKVGLLNETLEDLLTKGITTKGDFRRNNPHIDASWNGTLKESHTLINLAFISDIVQLPDVKISIPFFPVQDLLDDGVISSIIQGTVTVINPKFDLPIAQLDEITLPWILNIADNSLKMNIVAKQNGNEPQQVKGSLRVDEFIVDGSLDLSHATMLLNLNLEAFKTDGLQPYMSKYPVKRIFGPALDAGITISRDAPGSITGSVEVSPNQPSEAFVKRIFNQFELHNENNDITFVTETQQAIGASNFSGTFHNALTPEGNFNFNETSFSLQGHLKHFPVGIIARVVTGDEKIADTMEAILGTQVDGDIFAEITNHQGPVRFSLKGLNGQCNVDAKIVDRVVYLNQPITASLKVTPQLEHAVLREYLPILGSVVSAEKPIEVSIPVEDFRIPLKPPTVGDIQFKNGILKLDKMLFVRESPLGKIVSVLGVQSPKFLVWFTPIYFSMNQGIIQMYRTDMLVADSFPVAAWGNVNLIQQQMDLTIALSGAAIKKAFSFNGINSNSWLQIPIRGDLHHPKIDVGAITARVTALAAISKAGPPGQIIGTVIEKASDLIGLDQAPEPTTKPIPWQDQLGPEVSSGNINKLDEFIEQPIDDIKKNAKKLFKGLFQ